MWWDKFTAWLDSFTQNPTVVAIFSVLSTFVGVFVIFSRTSVGRKTLLKLLDLGHKTEECALETARKVEEHKKETEEKILELKDYYEQKIALVLSVANYYEETLFDTLSLIPNAKVQAKVNETRENYEAKKKVIEEQVGLIYQDFELAVDEKAKSIEEVYAEKYKLIYTELENLKLQIQPYQKSVDEILENTEPVEEEDYGEEENTDSEEKGI